jgi:hypothetical protein
MHVAQRPPGISEPLPKTGPTNLNGGRGLEAYAATHSELTIHFSF